MRDVRSTLAVPPHPNRLLAALSPPERARLAPFLEPIALEFRQIMIKAEASIPYALFLQDAVAATVTELPEGELIETGVMGPEGLAGHGLLYGMPATTTVIVVIPGRALRMRGADFQREIVEHGGEAFRLLLRYGHAFLGIVVRIAACNASHGVAQRFARWLLLLHDRVGQETFPLTHEFAALLLGVRRAGVTEVASRLRNAGIIDYRAGEMRIRNRAQLEGVACSCYEAITRLMETPFANN